MNETNPVQLRWNEVDRYLEQQLIGPDSLMENVLKNNHAAGLPPFDVTPTQGKFLHLLVQLCGAKHVLEIGTLGGYSTIWMARALPEDGHIVTLEVSPHHAETAARNFKLAGLEERITIRTGDALEQLAHMNQELYAPFDLIFIDADKPNNPHYLNWALHFSRPGTVIVGDNVVREGEIIDHLSSDPRIQGVRSFYDQLRNEPRVSATALQTVGSKGYDGFMIGIVNG
ncbi:O-methyltransferase [Paenibacillus puldeungensis]|uniref:O-methyltransferase n=1 Tax=Paenibacillus puldeungensis TaxID=696536 RepID=A0ABW3S2I2_9BACL